MQSLFGCQPLCLVSKSGSAWHDSDGGGGGGDRDCRGDRGGGRLDAQIKIKYIRQIAALFSLETMRAARGMTPTPAVGQAP